jgi:fatty acid CoA ligase FadD9
MPPTTREERLARRVEELSANDPQFAAAKPNPAVAEALEQPGLRLPQIIQTVLEGYADRPALGQRVVEFVKDPKTGRTSLGLVPRYETITYRELGERVGAVVRALTGDPNNSVHAGDRVCVLGFNSVDFTTIDVALAQIGAVSVPLQTSAAITQLQPIVAETEPTLVAASVNQLPDAVELLLASGSQNGPMPAKLVVFDYHPEVDDQREALETARVAARETARERLADSAVVVETLADVLERGKALPEVSFAGQETSDDALALLIYTSGSTGAPKGAMYPQSNVGKMWRRSSRNRFGRAPRRSRSTSCR